MGMTSDRDWQKWGKTDPYFGVMTGFEFRGDQIAGNLERFFETGRRDVSETLAQIKRFYGDIPTSRALDFGCGVGRLVIPLSERFAETVGVDISESMIQEARKNCAAKNVRNVDFVNSDDDLKLITGSFDLVHSYNVLQHIPIARGLVLTDRLLSLVKPGGVAVLHYSLHRTLSAAKACAYAMKHHVPFGRVAMNLLQSRKWDMPAMQMNNYSLAEILAVCEKRDMENFVVVPEQHSAALTARIFARRR
jgi:2-polyprenyl-3-methyl-5-hydroxy-6-metoxy-1,4-benzoquinol methylase